MESNSGEIYRNIQKIKCNDTIQFVMIDDTYVCIAMIVWWGDIAVNDKLHDAYLDSSNAPLWGKLDTGLGSRYFFKTCSPFSVTSLSHEDIIYKSYVYIFRNINIYLCMQSIVGACSPYAIITIVSFIFTSTNNIRFYKI